ncbi:MAG: hypothetical protein U0838_15075 [Chloroflexota bacterium]
MRRLDEAPTTVHTLVLLGYEAVMTARPAVSVVVIIAPPPRRTWPAEHVAVAVAVPMVVWVTGVPVTMTMFETLPAGPCAPVAPVAPVSPFGPCGPVAPVSPLGRGRPAVPADLLRPCHPWRRCRPSARGRPAAPADPWHPSRRAHPAGLSPRIALRALCAGGAGLTLRALCAGLALRSRVALRPLHLVAPVAPGSP